VFAVEDPSGDVLALGVREKARAARIRVLIPDTFPLIRHCSGRQPRCRQGLFSFDVSSVGLSRWTPGRS
jgi:hypothetical protein